MPVIVVVVSDHDFCYVLVGIGHALSRSLICVRILYILAESRSRPR